MSGPFQQGAIPFVRTSLKQFSKMEIKKVMQRLLKIEQRRLFLASRPFNRRRGLQKGNCNQNDVPPRISGQSDDDNDLGT